MSQADTAIQFALAQVGKPYKWGATGPNAFDCSGLVQAAYRAAGISLPRTTYQQVLVGTRIPKASLMPGDLVFPDAGHVQIYLGNGKVVEAPHTGANVRVLNMWGYWTARRVASTYGANPYYQNASGNNDCYNYAPNPYGGSIPIPNGKCKDPGVPTPPGSNVVPDITNGITGLIDAFQAIGDALSWITEPSNWLRIAEFAAGILLLIVGLIGLSRFQSAAKAAGKVASNAAA